MTRRSLCPQRNAGSSQCSAECSPAPNYRLLGFIGSGSYGNVHLVRLRGDTEARAMKEIVTCTAVDEYHRQAAEKDARLLSTFQHPSLLTHYGALINSEGHLCLIMEYCAHGSLESYLRAAWHANELPAEDRVLQWTVQLALALHALHERGVLHQDLKIESVFPTCTNPLHSGAVKLGGLGVARALRSTKDFARALRHVAQREMSSQLQPPELILGKRANKKSDIWLFGCLVHMLFSGRRAFEADSIGALANKINEGLYFPPGDICSQEVQAVIVAMLSRKRSHRPALREILHTPSIKNQVHAAVNSIAASKAEIDVLVKQLESLGLESPVGGCAADPEYRSGNLRHRPQKGDLNPLHGKCARRSPPTPTNTSQQNLCNTPTQTPQHSSHATGIAEGMPTELLSKPSQPRLQRQYFGTELQQNKIPNNCIGESVASKSDATTLKAKGPCLPRPPPLPLGNLPKAMSNVSLSGIPASSPLSRRSVSHSSVRTARDMYCQQSEQLSSRSDRVMLRASKNGQQTTSNLTQHQQRQQQQQQQQQQANSREPSSSYTPSSNSLVGNAPYRNISLPTQQEELSAVARGVDPNSSLLKIGVPVNCRAHVFNDYLADDVIHQTDFKDMLPCLDVAPKIRSCCSVPVLPRGLGLPCQDRICVIGSVAANGAQ